MLFLPIFLKKNSFFVLFKIILEIPRVLLEKASSGSVDYRGGSVNVAALKRESFKAYRLWLW